jgi:2-dehydro-3-deoxygalactonokinase
MGDFISGDWGTSRLRLRLMRGSPLEVLAEVQADRGIAATYQEWHAAGAFHDREPFYLQALAPDFHELIVRAGGTVATGPLVLSGMASSSIGLRALPYAPVPFPLSGETLPTAIVPSGPFPVDVLLCSGVRTHDDVMRGEETIVMGLAAGDATYVLPGTHSKHVDVKDGAIRDFRTYFTGELFALLRQHSVLRESLEAAPGPDDAFLEAVRESPGTELLHELFLPRSRGLLLGTSAHENGQRLLGALIGHELVRLPRDRPIVLAASPPLDSFYLDALVCLGHDVRAATPEDLALAVARGQAMLLVQHAGQQ